MSPSILLVGDLSARLGPFRNELPDAVSGVATHPELPCSLRDVTENGVVTTLVVSLDALEMCPTSAVRRVRQRWPWVSLLLVDGPSSTATATAALKAGAADYLVRERSHPAGMAEAVERCLRSRPSVQTGNPVLQYVNPEHVVGNSEAMQPVLDRLDTAIGSSMNVLIQGEPGTGRSLMARAIHAQSASTDTPLLTLNCRCLDPERARAFFFGNRRTDSTASLAALGEAYQETIVLDHLDGADREVQNLLLHALDSGRFATSDASSVAPSSRRLIGITASAPSPDALQADLHYRLAELPMSLPPLRERTGDLFPLTRHFLHCHTDSGGPDDPPFSTEARTALREYPWPGNVRQLKNVVVRAACRRSASTIERGDLLLPDPQSVPHARPSDGSEGEPDGAERPPLSPGGEADASAEPTAEAAASPSEDDILSLQEIKKRAVKHAYEMFDGDVDQAAVALDIGRSTMYRMLKRHDLREDES